MDKANPVVMDSSTYGLPINSRLGYKQTINWATRISTDGIYLHELEDTVWAQGNTNVSHGCLNLNGDNARWFFDFSQPGDVVEVYRWGAAAGLAERGLSYGTFGNRAARWAVSVAASTKAASRTVDKMAVVRGNRAPVLAAVAAGVCRRCRRRRAQRPGANPWYMRMTPPPGWSYAARVSSAVSRVAGSSRPATGLPRVPSPSPAHGVGANIAAFLAVGCPVCNKLVVAAAGASGALAWWAPLQPLVAVVSVALLGWALWTRLAAGPACPVPPAGAGAPTVGDAGMLR